MATFGNVGESWFRATAWRPTKWNLSLAVGLGILGLALSLQWKTEPAASATDSPGRSISDNTIQRLEEDQRSLKAGVGYLQKQIQEYQQIAGARKENLSGITRSLDRQKVQAGIVGLSGQGVKVVVDDSTKSPSPNDDPANFIVHEYQLRDVVNLLWRAGAEAISINDERLVGTSSIYCVGSTIMVNSTRMSPPYELRAIGNASTLEETLNNPNLLRKLKSVAKQYGMEFKVQKAKDVYVPPYTGVFTMKYLTPSRQP